MPPSNSLAAFDDCRRLFERAEIETKGIEVRGLSASAAINLVQRLNSFRAKDRKESYKTYQHDHPLYGRSPFDIIQVQRRLVGETWSVCLVKMDAANFDVVPLE